MDLVCITDASRQFGISSKTLRYYEQVGLLASKRLENNKYRFYDGEAVERIKQILILRKMQISIKDIIRIYENEDMSTVVEVFVNRIQAIDEEVGALSELRRITNDFLQTMIQNGITKISALPFIYEEIDKQLNILGKDKDKNMSYTTLSALSAQLAKPIEPSIINLPPMRVLSSYLKENPRITDSEGFWDWVQEKGISPGEPGLHERFEFQAPAGDVIILRIDDDFVNDSPYLDYTFEGGLFAAVNIYLDEDLGEHLRSLISSFDDNKYYEINYINGGLRHEVMLENLISPDEKREMASLFAPVKKRLTDPAVFDKPEQINPNSITTEEIEKANPVLWTKDIAMDKLIPESDWSYRVNEQNIGEYTPVIDTHSISTGIDVSLPFRVDIEFKIDNSAAAYGYGSDEGSICFYHGANLFGINKGNYSTRQDEAIIFIQPIFGDRYYYPKIGKINTDSYNRLTWIVGEKHFAVIINGEVRYCGVDFPYMKADRRLQQPEKIIISSGGTGKKYLKSISISQLKETRKNNIKKGELTMITKQSNNVIPNIHRLITSDHGENYWFNGAAKYVMECLDEPEYDYWFFAGLTGENFAQNYALNGGFLGDGVVDFLLNSSSVMPGEYFEKLFTICGYASTFVGGKDLRKNIEMYIQTLIAYIDKGVPVILYGHGGPPYGVFVGYEEHGKVLLYITGDRTEPERITIDTAVGSNDIERFGWIFVGEKKEQKELKQIYRNAIVNLPELLTTQTDTYCFGAEAFRAWAAEIENGRFDGMKPEQFDGWCMYQTYVCCLATNSGGCCGFLNKAQELNPDFTFLEDVRRQYRITGLLWNANHEAGDGFAGEYLKQHGNLPDNLEAIGGGFNITLEALQNPEKRSRIVATIRKFAGCIDEVVRILQENL